MRGCRVLVKRLTASKMSASGALHVVRRDDKSNEGVVVAVGPGRFDPDAPNYRIPMSCEIGDHVIFGQYAGFEWYYKDEAYMVCLDEDICMVLREPR
jgi:chaperonin GroES